MADERIGNTAKEDDIDASQSVSSGQERDLVIDGSLGSSGVEGNIDSEQSLSSDRERPSGVGEDDHDDEQRSSGAVAPRECPPDCIFRIEPSPPWQTPMIPSLASRSATLREQARIAAELYTSGLKPWQVRVLALQPGEPGAGLVASLCTADLILDDGIVLHDQQRRVDYTALSYTWDTPADGIPVLDHVINLNGLKYFMTANLSAALQQARSKTETQFWWIDALCINQHDQSERSVQVAKMLHIYWKASVVRVWLGAGTTSERIAMQYLAEHPGHRGPHSTLCFVNVLDGLYMLYARPWFRRVWIRQEVWAARDIVVCCGDQRIRWSDLLRAGFEFEELSKQLSRLHAVPHQSRLASHRRQSQHIYAIRRSKPGVVIAVQETRRALARSAVVDFESRYRPTSEDIDLLYLLSDASSSECSVDLDRVYGLIAMSSAVYRARDEAPAEDGVEIIIDYAKSLGEVFQDITKYVMQRTCSLLPLYFDTQFGDEDLGLPTWSPDWRQRINNLPRVEPFPIPGRKPKLIGPLSWESIDPTVLKVRGLFAGTIAADEILASGGEWDLEPGSFEGQFAYRPWLTYPEPKSRPVPIRWTLSGNMSARKRAYCSCERGRRLPVDSRPRDEHEPHCVFEALAEDLMTQLTQWYDDGDCCVPLQSRRGDKLVIAEVGRPPLVLRPQNRGFSFLGYASSPQLMLLPSGTEGHLKYDFNDREDKFWETVYADDNGQSPVREIEIV